MLKISEKLKKADIFCFDVDSTVLNNEGIDLLSKYLKLDNRVSEITNVAMARVSSIFGVSQGGRRL